MDLFKRKRDKVEAFKKQTRGADKVKKREMEEQMLTPDSIETYTGDNPENFGIDALTVSIVFPDNKVKASFEKHLKISYSKVKKQQYVTDISLLIDFMKALDDGSLIYDNGKFGLGTEFKIRKSGRRSF